jgi:hypothetical protein
MDALEAEAIASSARAAIVQIARIIIEIDSHAAGMRMRSMFSPGVGSALLLPSASRRKA